MARVKITPKDLARGGITTGTEADGDAVNGHTVPNSGKTLIVVRNADAVNPHNVTFVTPGTVDEQAIADRTVAIPASSTRWFGRFQPSVYGSALAVNVDSSQLKITAYEP